MNPGIYHLSKNIEKIIPRKGSLEGIVFPKMAKNKTLETIKFKNALWFSIEYTLIHPKFFFFLRNFSIRFDL